ncbi:centrosomal protein [Tasmannia lanceolata]|uniref:centrosomal protein n=1 Tax=Tasmannia lanceolata TaxID=3420 RepID=UPI0040638F1C
MSILWEKSETWRWIVRKSRDSKPFFFTFATLCGVVPGVIGYCVMQATSSKNEQLEAQLRKTQRPESLMMAKANKEWLAEYLGELQRKEDTNDRYVAALRGETLTRNPYVRIQPVPKQPDDNVPKQTDDNKKEKK